MRSSWRWTVGSDDGGRVADMNSYERYALQGVEVSYKVNLGPGDLGLK